MNSFVWNQVGISRGECCICGIYLDTEDASAKLTDSETYGFAMTCPTYNAFEINNCKTSLVQFVEEKLKHSEFFVLEESNKIVTKKNDVTHQPLMLTCDMPSSACTDIVLSRNEEIKEREEKKDEPDEKEMDEKLLRFREKIIRRRRFMKFGRDHGYPFEM